MRVRDDKSYLAMENKNVFPGDIYRQVILEPHYEEARDQLLQGMMAIHQAHGLMLAEEGIVEPLEIQQILQVLGELDDEVEWKYDPAFEDIFFQIENKLVQKLGENIAGQLHTGRSRNDMDAALYRMVLREKALVLADQLCDFRRVLLKICEEHLETIVLGYTHTQPAQPTTLAHYLEAVVDFLERDFQRLQEFYTRINLSPMGAGALTTTSFPINRETVAKYLGFEGILENSYDCVGGSDHLAEASCLLVVMMTSLTRMLYDFLLYAMVEFDVIRISDAYVQVSSIMPQKRNPVSLEHSRSLATSVIGQAQTVTTMLTNTPFGDIVDKEPEMQKHLWSAWERSIQLYRLLTVVFAGMEFNQKLLYERSRESFAVVTQLAETIVQYTDLSFRQAHHVVSRVVREALEQGIRVTGVDAQLVNQVSQEVLGYSLEFSEDMVRDALDARKFVALRTRPGGPAPGVMKEQLAKRQQHLKADEGWIDQLWMQLEKSEQLLQSKVDELLERAF